MVASSCESMTESDEITWLNKSSTGCFVEHFKENR